jgi:geranylgeranyl diphosphate synthase type II
MLIVCLLSGVLKVDPRIVLRVVAYVAKCVGSEGLVGGQIVDIEMESVNRGGMPASLETLQYIHAHKTAALLDAAVVCGALLGASSVKRNCL